MGTHFSRFQFENFSMTNPKNNGSYIPFHVPDIGEEEITK